MAVVTRRRFLAALAGLPLIGRFVLAPAEPITYRGTPIVFDSGLIDLRAETYAGIERSMNRWWRTTVEPEHELMEIGVAMKAAFDECVRESTPSDGRRP